RGGTLLRGRGSRRASSLGPAGPRRRPRHQGGHAMSSDPSTPPPAGDRPHTGPESRAQPNEHFPGDDAAVEAARGWLIEAGDVGDAPPPAVGRYAPAAGLPGARAAAAAVADVRRQADRFAGVLARESELTACLGERPRADALPALDAEAAACRALI